MKKTLLLASLLAGACTTFAQVSPYTLTGTSYSQNFDGIGSGLPTGWAGYISATSSSYGNFYIDSISGAPVPFGSTSYGRYADSAGNDTLSGMCASDIFGAGFKNCPSNDAGAGTNAMNCGAEQAVTNRAFAVRQKSSGGYDPGVAFVFCAANTTGLSNFMATFNLESLDQTSPRVTTWAVDYGFGTSPSVFTPVPSASVTATSMSTGGYTFTNVPVTVNFGNLLDNQSQNVWIRIAALTGSTNTLGGSGKRTTSGIDDFHLMYSNSTTGVTNMPTAPTTSLVALGQATTDKISLSYNVTDAGAYTLTIYDIAGRILHSETVNAQNGGTITINSLHLAPGMYVAKMNNGNSSAIARIAVQ